MGSSILVVVLEPLDATCRIYFPDQGSNSSSLPWECGVLAIETPGKSWKRIFKNVNLLIAFYWSIVALQYSVSFYCIAKWISHKCTYPLPVDFLPTVQLSRVPCAVYNRFSLVIYCIHSINSVYVSFPMASPGVWVLDCSCLRDCKAMAPLKLPSPELAHFSDRTKERSGNLALAAKTFWPGSNVSLILIAHSQHQPSCPAPPPTCRSQEVQSHHVSGSGEARNMWGTALMIVVCECLC